MVKLVWEASVIFVDQAILATPTRSPGHNDSQIVSDVTRRDLHNRRFVAKPRRRQAAALQGAFGTGISAKFSA
jgi:hypothetical protein